MVRKYARAATTGARAKWQVTAPRPTYFVHEWYVWDGEVYDGVLGANRPSSEIETVACTNCGAEYDPGKFEEIHFG